MSAENLAKRVVDTMYRADGFSAWLGIKVESIAAGHSKCSMTVRKEMLNGFGTCHGGIAYSLADSAFAFAANSHGRLSVAADTNISYPAPVYEGDVLTAEARELECGEKLGFYQVDVRNQKNEFVAFFRGTVYRTQKKFFPEEV